MPFFIYRASKMSFFSCCYDSIFRGIYPDLLIIPSTENRIIKKRSYSLALLLLRQLYNFHWWRGLLHNTVCLTVRYAARKASEAPPPIGDLKFWNFEPLCHGEYLLFSFNLIKIKRLIPIKLDWKEKMPNVLIWKHEIIK